MRGESSPLGWLAAASVLVAVAGQDIETQRARFDPTSLGRGSHSRACVLLERTIFRVDVLTLDLRFGAETSGRIRRLVEAGAGRDTIGAVALGSRDAWARIEFLRDVSMDRFIDGVRADLRRAVEGGVIDPQTFEHISRSLPRWYGFLDTRGVRAGDRLLYRIRGDTLHSGYRSSEGAWLLEQTDVGPERRRAVLGSYLVDGSSFRDGLLADLVAGRPGGC